MSADNGLHEIGQSLRVTAQARESDQQLVAPGRELEQGAAEQRTLMNAPGAPGETLTQRLDALFLIASWAPP